MLIIGLTGGIATGKSTTASFFRERDIPVHDADATVHQLMQRGGAATPKIIDAFSPVMVTETGDIDRGALGAHVFNHPADRKRLEAILHPLVSVDRDQFLSENRALNTPAVVLDVPLLFETGGDAMCDLIVVVAVSDEIQQARTMQRPGMTTEKMRGILASQMALAEKCEGADFILHTEHGLDQARADLFAWLDGNVVTNMGADVAGSENKG